MRLDVYTCSACGKGFAVEENKQPTCCPFCYSDTFEYSHDASMFSLSDDEFIELEMYIDFAINQLGEIDGQKLSQFFTLIRQRSQEIKDERWRNDSRNWGACSKWPYEDEFPF